MANSMSKMCLATLLALAASSSGTFCLSQNYNQSESSIVQLPEPNTGYNDASLPNGGLRGPQDIINSTNARDSYGNPRPADGGYGYNPAGASPAPGSITPFTPGPSTYQTGAGGYPASQPGPGPFQGSPGAPPSAPAKHHHHHNHQQPADPSASGYAPPGSSAYAPAGSAAYAPPGSAAYAPPGSAGYAPPGSAAYLPPGGLTNAPPGAAYAPVHSGNSSIGGAVVGVPDRAAKTAIGVPKKAAKEVLKAIF